MSDETRVVLVKPGDVLVFGNVGNMPESVRQAAAHLRELLGIRHVVIFANDIDMAAVPAAVIESEEDA